MLRYVIKFFTVLSCVFLLMTPSFAAESPVAMLEKASQQMIGELQRHQTTLKSNPGLVHRLVYQILLPHVDAATMSKAVAGREAWMSANEGARKQFVRAFTDLVVRTYSSALASYSNETVEFLPLRNNEGNSVQVNSRIIRKGGPAISVSYHLLSRNGRWYVYDLIVENVSLVQNFRSQLAEPIRQGGLTAGTAQIQNHHP